jgi:predicted nucleic acid-binding protein
LEKISAGKLKGVYASTAALQEIVFWFYNRRLFDDLAKAVNFLTHLRNVEWIAVTPEICLTASLLMSERDVSPFDAYHVATAILRDKKILSTDHAYDKIKGVERIDPLVLVNNP